MALAEALRGNDLLAGTAGGVEDIERGPRAFTLRLDGIEYTVAVGQGESVDTEFDRGHALRYDGAGAPVRIVGHPVAVAVLGQEQDDAVVVGGAQRRRAVVDQVERRVGVTPGHREVADQLVQSAAGQGVVQDLRAAPEDEAVALFLGDQQRLVHQVRIDQVVAVVGLAHQVLLRYEITLHVAGDVHVGVAELESVEITDHDQVDVRVGVLQGLGLGRDGLGLFEALLAHAVPVEGIVDAAQRAAVHDHDRKREVAAVGRVAALEQQRRAIVQQRAVIAQQFRGAQLGHLIDRDAVPGQEADVDAAHVVALHQEGGIGHGRVVGRNLGRQVLQHAQLLHFLNGQHVRRIHHVADEVGELAQPARVLGTVDHLLAAIVDVVEQAEQVERPDGHLGRTACRYRNGDDGRGEVKPIRPQLVAAELETDDPGRAEARAGRDDLVRQAQLVRIQFEHFRIAVPDRVARQSRVLDAGLAEGALRRRRDMHLGDGIRVEALVRAGDGAAGDLDPHALVALEFDRAARRRGIRGRYAGVEHRNGRQAVAGRIDRDGSARTELGKAEELLHRAADVDLVADRDRRGCAGEHEDAVRRVDIEVVTRIRRLYEEAVSAERGHDVVLAGDSLAFVRRSVAAALDVEDLQHRSDGAAILRQGVVRQPRRDAGEYQVDIVLIRVVAVREAGDALVVLPRGTGIDQAAAGALGPGRGGVALVTDGVQDDPGPHQRHRVGRAVLDQVAVGRHVEVAVGHVGRIAADHEQFAGAQDDRGQGDGVVHGRVIAVDQHQFDAREVDTRVARIDDFHELRGIAAGLVIVDLVDQQARRTGVRAVAAGGRIRATGGDATR